MKPFVKNLQNIDRNKMEKSGSVQDQKKKHILRKQPLKYKTEI